MSDLEVFDMGGTDFPGETRVEVNRKYLDGGIQVRFLCENGWGASVIRHQYSYGGDVGLFEMATTDDEGSVVDDGIFGEAEVQGWLTPENVVEYLHEIANLPPRAKGIEDVRNDVRGLPTGSDE